MLIKNFEALSTTPQRKDALEIINAGLESVIPENALKSKIKVEGNNLSVDGNPFDLSKYKKIIVIGIGKASLKSAQFLESILEDKITDGAIIDIQDGPLKKIKPFIGTHPVPSQQNIDATHQIEKLLENLTEDTIVICIMSGGGSALLTDPTSLPIDQLKEVFDKLLKSGANITEMNTIRKHISKVHGGNLAKLAYPATVIGLIFSDIPTSDLSVVASGPTYKDETTVEDAKKVLGKYNLGELELTETPKEEKYFLNVHNFLVLGNTIALESMNKKAQELGYRGIVLTSQFQSDTATAGQKILGQLSQPKLAIIVGGETTVSVKGSGKGGRNQEVPLAALLFLKPGQLIMSVASDGKDNIEDAAGALADQQTLEKMKQKALDPQTFLDNNDSFNFFNQTGDLIITGLTGSNVSDLLLALSE